MSRLDFTRGIFEALDAAGKLPDYDRKALTEIRSALNAK
jgi:hypothetical protein